MVERIKELEGKVSFMEGHREGERELRFRLN